ncbi:MAG: phage tail tape measure protein [Cyclobacteriaceae bacterium]
MGKKVKDEDLILNIIVNGDRGRKELNKLDRSVRDLNQDLNYLEATERKLRAANKQNTAEYQKITQAITQKKEALRLANEQLDNARANMDLNKMSVRELKAEMIRLKRLAMDPLNKDWARHANRLQQVKARYTELDARAKQTGLTLKGISGSITRSLGSIAAGIATVSAALFGIRRASDAFVSFDDKVADVQKTTGLTKDEVLSLNEALKDTEVIDTRTSQENLLGLGRIAGKLGIEGRDNLIGFIKAADEISVALTEDLGGDVEQSINTLGKLVDVFDVDNEFGIEEGLRKTGSLINELGARSSASEEEIVDFLSRLAGIGPSAKISISNIAGLGSTLSQLKQSMEVSGTTFVNIIPKMFTNTAKFAEIAGMGVEEFSDLLNNDANEALIRFLEGLRGNNQGMEYMMKLLESLNLDGARAKNILSVMANNTDKLRKEQALANEAFEEGTSILEEFNTKNTNAAAQLDKAKKGVNNMWIELGEKLYPVMLESVGLFEKFLKIISILIDFTREHKTTIIALTASVIAYNVVVKAQILWTTRATIAQRALNLAMKLNPVPMFIALLTALGVALHLYSRRTKEAISAADEFNAMQKKANDAAAAEEIKIKALLKVGRDKTKLDTERNAAIQELIKLSPQVLGSLSLETINTDNAAAAVKRYIQAKKDQYLIDEIVAKQQELKNQKENTKEELESSRSRLDELKSKRGSVNNFVSEDPVLEAQKKAQEQRISDKEKELEEIEKLELANEAKLNQIYDRQLRDKAKIFTESEAERLRIERQNREKQNAELTKKEIEEREKFRAKILLESKSLIEQENAAHQERLKQAGLLGKQRSELTEQDLAVLEVLEATHQANLSKIDADAIKDEISRIEANHQRNIDDLHVAQNQELKIFKGTKEERKKLLEAHQREEEQLTEDYANRLMQILQSVMDSGQWTGITSDDILSDEEKAELEAKINEIRLLLSELGVGATKSKSKPGDNLREDGGNNLNTSGADILGFTPDDWSLFFENLKNGKIGIQELQFAANALGEAWRTHNDYLKAAEDRKLEQYESNIEKRKQSLEQAMESELSAVGNNTTLQAQIRERYNDQIDKLDADLERKKAKYARNQAIRDRNVALMSAIVNTAAAVAAALPNIALSIIAGIAGAAQVATISATPLPQIPGAEDGGFFDVVRSQDRKFFRAKQSSNKRGYVDRPTIIAGESGREFVASNEAYNNPTVRPVLDAIDTAQRNGSISTVNIMKVLNDRPAYPGRQSGGYFNEPVAKNQTASYPSSSNGLSAEDAELKQLMRMLYIRFSKPIQAKVSLLGENGFYEAEDEYNKIESETNI